MNTAPYEKHRAFAAPVLSNSVRLMPTSANVPAAMGSLKPARSPGFGRSPRPTRPAATFGLLRSAIAVHSVEALPSLCVVALLAASMRYQPDCATPDAV